MDSLKNVAKGGWHPEGKGVAGWLGRDVKTSSSSSSTQHVAAPLSSLKDPASFGPPPKSVNRTDSVVSPSSPTPASASGTAPASTLPPGDPSSHPSVHQTESPRPPPPPGPFKVDTTGIQTQGLPPPPTRVVQPPETNPHHGTNLSHDTSTAGAAAHRQTSPPVPPRSANQPPAIHGTTVIGDMVSPSTAGAPSYATAGSAKPKPALPPRLPPRDQGTLGSGKASSPPKPGSPLEVERPLKPASPPKPAVQSATAAPSIPTPAQDAGHAGSGTLNELQARFAKMATKGDAPEAHSTTPAARKGPPPPPRTGVNTDTQHRSTGSPPPVPLATKPV